MPAVLRHHWRASTLALTSISSRTTQRDRANGIRRVEVSSVPRAARGSPRGRVADEKSVRRRNNEYFSAWNMYDTGADLVASLLCRCRALEADRRSRGQKIERTATGELEGVGDSSQIESRGGDGAVGLAVAASPEWQEEKGTSRRQRRRCPQSVARFTTVSIERRPKATGLYVGLRLSAHYTPCVPVFSSEHLEPSFCPLFRSLGGCARTRTQSPRR